MKDNTPTFCVGEWLPSDEASFGRWMEGLHQAEARPLHPCVQAFKDCVLHDPALFALANQMFEQIPDGEAFAQDPTGKPQERSFARILHMINVVLTTPPMFNKTGLTGLPINAMIDWSLATTSGYAFFLHATVNRHLKAILCAWGQFLTTRDSLPALSDDPRTGWFGEDAMAEMPDFDSEFACEPGQPYRGFTSWDHFFTRQFRAGRRPVAAPDDDAVIVSPCEAAPFRLARHVRLLDRFWIKAQPYSLQHMLASDERAPQFDGGTVYQAFLSSFSYHRWHSPVSGRIVKIPGGRRHLLCAKPARRI